MTYTPSSILGGEDNDECYSNSSVRHLENA